MNLSNWTLDPSARLRGDRRLPVLAGRRGRPSRDPRQWLRTVSFVAGLATIVVALDSPLDTYADELFWVHMTQHILLLTVAPPLILLGRPWPRMWRALPLQTRTTVGRTIARARWTAPLRALARPAPAWVLFNATIVVWHIPALYNATLTSRPVHNLEHAMFFFTGLLFWARVVDPGPLRPTGLGGAGRLRGRRDGRRLGAGDRAGVSRTPCTPTTPRSCTGPGGSRPRPTSRSPAG